jgi:hypothetical protein
MTATFGTNSAGTKEWLAATKDMHLSAADPVFTRTMVTITRPSDELTKQEFESALKKVSRRTRAEFGTKKK